jgi:hypothetical protein
MCGRAPGEVSAKIFDPTIIVDGEPFWRDGTFVFMDDVSVVARADDYQVPATLLRERRPIGI